MPKLHCNIFPPAPTCCYQRYVHPSQVIDEAEGARRSGRAKEQRRGTPANSAGEGTSQQRRTSAKPVPTVQEKLLAAESLRVAEEAAAIQLQKRAAGVRSAELRDPATVRPSAALSREAIEAACQAKDATRRGSSARLVDRSRDELELLLRRERYDRADFERQLALARIARGVAERSAVRAQRKADALQPVLDQLKALQKEVKRSAAHRKRAQTLLRRGAPHCSRRG